jgi:uncharacterized protein (DUF3084 family)
MGGIEQPQPVEMLGEEVARREAELRSEFARRLELQAAAHQLDLQNLRAEPS